MRWTLVVISLLVIMSSPVRAEPDTRDPIDIKMGACIDKDPSTAGMLGCAETAEEDWDRALNKAYQELQVVLKGRPRDALREAQRAWIVQRDREYAVHEAMHRELSGTMWGPVMADQRVTMIRVRTQQLRGYLDFYREGRR